MEPNQHNLPAGKLPAGIIPIVQTPYGASGDVDFQALRRLVDYTVSCGAAALITPAVASEVDRLTDDERRRIVETVVDATQGRVPVVVGASSPSLDTCITLAEHGRGLGCGMMLVQAPHTDDGEIVKFFTELSRSVDMNLMIQDLDWHESGMSIELIAHLFDILPRFRYVKVETANACPKYTQILDRTGGKLFVSGGWAVMQLMEALDRGVQAFMPESSMVRIYETIRRLHAAGKRDEARAVFRELLPVLAFANQQIEISIHFFKRLLVRRGIFTTPHVRPPTCAFDSIQDALAEELIQRVLDIEAEIAAHDD